MHRGSSRPSLGERAADSGVRPGGPLPGTATPPRVREDGTGRHCWVHTPPGTSGTVPGLLVEWRQRPEGWQGRVAYAVPGPHGPVLVEAWLPAGSLEQR